MAVFATAEPGTQCFRWKPLYVLSFQHNEESRLALGLNADLFSIKLDGMCNNNFAF
jgi:hypothetical protein